MNILQSLKRIKLPLKALLITAGVVVLLAVIILSLALSERQSRLQAAQDTEKAEAANTRLNKLQADNDALRASNNDKKSRLSAVCTYVTALSGNKVAKPAVVVPAACK